MNRLDLLILFARESNRFVGENQNQIQSNFFFHFSFLQIRSNQNQISFLFYKRSNLFLLPSCPTLGLDLRKTEKNHPSYGLKINQIKSNFNVQFLDIFGGEDEGDISNSWTRREREEMTNSWI